MTTADRRRLGRIVDLHCLVCYGDAEAHHVPPMRRRPGDETGIHRDDRYVLPLCPKHHRAGDHGEALHAGVDTWEARYGTQAELLTLVDELLSQDSVRVFGPAEEVAHA